MDSNVNETRRPAGSSPLVLAVAWLIVGVPAAWGVTQTIKQSLKLFAAPAAAPTQPAAR